MMNNLLLNPGFEKDWGVEASHAVLICEPGRPPRVGEVGNVFTPPNWLVWYLHDEDHAQPEVRDAWLSGDPRRVHSGEKAILFFTFYRRHQGGFLQQVNVQPGQWLRLTAWMHAWSNNKDPDNPEAFPHPDDGRWSEGAGYQEIAWEAGTQPYDTGDPQQDAKANFNFAVGIDPTGGCNPLADSVVWGAHYHIYNGYCKQLSVEAVARADKVTVFTYSETLWPFKHNDLYLDDAALVVVDDEPPVPPPYESTMLVLPQDATQEQLAEIFASAYPDRRTFGFSHDDAGHLSGTAILYNIPDSERQAYLDFYTTRYPGVTVQFAYTSDWEDPPIPPSGLLLWQCDPRWKDEQIASDCSLTLCQIGCWVACCAMAQRFFGIKGDATPSTANQALGAAGGFSGCLTLWDEMKEALGLEVFERHYDDQRARDWLDGRNVCFAEVEPESYMHFVLVTGYSEGRFWMLDPYKNVEGWLDEYYPGAESWRSICPFEETPPPPPVRGSLVSLHLQSLVEGVMAPGATLAALRCFEPSLDMPSDLREYVLGYQETLEAALGFVARVKPSVIKIFQLEVAREIKARSPETVVVLRYFTGDQNLDGDLQAAAQAYVRSFQDSLAVNAEWIDCVESWNETVCSNNAASIQRAVAFDCHFADALMTLGLPVVPQLLNVAVGNPLESEVELLLPAVRQAIKWGGTLGYHAYGYAPSGGDLNDDWQYFAGRALEGWDPVFRAHGLYPKYIFGECGAYATCKDGWRSPLCLDGDWPLYLAQLVEFSDRIKAWNVLHGNRCLGGTLFTSGGFTWESFEITEAEMISMAAEL